MYAMSGTISLLLKNLKLCVLTFGETRATQVLTDRTLRRVAGYIVHVRHDACWNG